MIATIFHDSDGEFPDMITACGDTLEILRENALAECKKRNWNPDDCWSQVYANDKEIAKL